MDVTRTHCQFRFKAIFINNRRYLASNSLSEFIRKYVDEHCDGINIVADILVALGKAMQ